MEYIFKLQDFHEVKFNKREMYGESVDFWNGVDGLAP